MNPKKKKSALEISNEIGIHGGYKDYTKFLEDEINRLKNGIVAAMNSTHDDDTHRLLDRLLKGEEE